MDPKVKHMEQHRKGEENKAGTEGPFEETKKVLKVPFKIKAGIKAGSLSNGP